MKPFFIFKSSKPRNSINKDLWVLRWLFSGCQLHLMNPRSYSCNTMFSIYCVLSSTVTNNSWSEAYIMHTLIFFMLCHDSIRDPSKDHNLIDFLLVSIALKRFLWVLLWWRVQKRIWSYSAAAQMTAAVSCLLWSKQQISKFEHL